MPDFKTENLQLLEATGLWPQYPLIQLKQWDEGKAVYAYGVLKDLDGDQYHWWPGDSWHTFMTTKPLLIGKAELERLVEAGWIVDC